MSEWIEERDKWVKDVNDEDLITIIYEVTRNYQFEDSVGDIAKRFDCILWLTTRGMEGNEFGIAAKHVEILNKQQTKMWKAANLIYPKSSDLIKDELDKTTTIKNIIDTSKTIKDYNKELKKLRLILDKIPRLFVQLPLVEDYLPLATIGMPIHKSKEDRFSGHTELIKSLCGGAGYNIAELWENVDCPKCLSFKTEEDK